MSRKVAERAADFGGGKTGSKVIVSEGEHFDAMSLRRWRENIMGPMEEPVAVSAPPWQRNRKLGNGTSFSAS